MNNSSFHGKNSVPQSAIQFNQGVAAEDPVPWLQLIRDRRWTQRQKFELLGHLGSAADIYAHSPTELRKLTSGRWPSRDAQIDAAQIDADSAWLGLAGNRLLCRGEQGFPQQLCNLPDPPFALFVSGDPKLLCDPAVAIVGSRRPTPSGVRLTQNIAAGLARAGVTVISGMALGIDGAAHQAALTADGATLAVMGCGLDIVYPPRHRDLFTQISERGCLVSEYPLGMQATRYTFPQRNRLVSGLSLGTIIIEAAERSGTLITARLTMEQNRTLMVVPGSPLSPQYAGSHTLLKQGAALVTCAEDVLLELEIPLREALNKNTAADNKKVSKSAHQALLEHIFNESTSVDSIISDSGLTAAEVSSMLLMLELEGAVALADDGGYVRLL